LKGTKDAAVGLRKLDRLFEKSTALNQLQLIEGLEFKLSPRQKEALYSAFAFFYSMQIKLIRSPAYLFLFFILIYYSSGIIPLMNCLSYL
jgi:hypothetical protein